MAPKIIKKPGPGDLKVERMRLIYTKAEQNIIKELTRKRSLELVDYSDLAALERVQKILRDMTDEAEEYIPIAMKEKFYKADDLASAPYGYYNAEALTGTQTAIVERLVDNLLADIDEAAAVAYKSAEEYLAVGRLEADALRNAALEMVTKLEAEGKGWNTIQNKMAAELNAKGITSFVDKAGRQWGLSSYCSMATRTTARQAEVAAALTSDDWDLWQIVKIGSTCPLCSVYEGRVYSKSGTNPDYPPLSTAFGKIDFDGTNDLANTYLNIHPNCQHSLIRYTTMGKTEEQIKRDKDFSSFEKRPDNVDYRSKKQVQAYREKEQARAQYRNDVKQFRKYKAALGNDMPKTFETFEKHKKAGDEVYKGWEEKFRKFSAEARKLDAEVLPETKIDFDFKGKDEKFEQSRELLLKLEQQYNTRLEKVTIGAQRAAGDVDITGSVMRLNSNDLSATIHEFAHTLANSDADKYGLTNDQEFWKEIKKIRTAYRKEVDKLRDPSKFISSYEHSRREIDEFMAEAFTQAKMRELGLTLPEKYGNDYTYSQQVLNAINKYFGKATSKNVELLGKSGIIKGTGTSKINLQFFANIPDEKLSSYSLDFTRQPDKAKAFKEALGYTKENMGELKSAIEAAFDESKLKYRGTNKYGDLYEQVFELVGPNGKKANVLSSWIKKPDEDYSMTSVYVTKKKVTR